MDLKKSLFRIAYKAHTFAGIFVAIHFAVFALSGVILLFKDELQGQQKSTTVMPHRKPDEVARAYEQTLT